MASDQTSRPHEDHPAKPDSPTDLTKRSWTYVATKSGREFVQDQSPDLAAALTYYAVLSIFPALIALVSILGLVGQAESTTDRLLGIMESFVPADAIEQLRPFVESLTSNQGAGLGLVLGLAVALWTASNYVNAFSRATNRIYGVEEGRPFWKLRPLMYLLTLVLLVLVAVVALLLVVSGPVAEGIGEVVGLGSTALTVWSIAKWPVLLLAFVVIVALLYHFTPNVRQPKFRWISVGAFIAIVIAILASVGFGLYLSWAGGGESYQATYGALAGVIIFLLLLWIMNLALLFGAEVDAELERSRQLQAGIPAEKEIRLPLRDDAAITKKAAKEEKSLARARAIRESSGRTSDPDDAPGPDPASGRGHDDHHDDDRTASRSDRR
ncbi:YihY/virulence factor BrkB family protein [Isoptericola sp. b515]|uniref:YihY/virulence factor BrkB family protein n=1 Tax=Isoptericola sp. b515 TaxID=3064652 RepID=UPI0027126ED6|nr:YihY/virulence factor BrkB family protein [Isoptericola sp. b515]MDO8147479.1 YihY/virulence factor BrkB family protein [Isoptericola sp. b515]